MQGWAESGSGQLALSPRHSGSLIAAVDTGRTRAGLDLSFTGEQRLDANPYRSTSEAFTLVNLFGEQRFGRFRLFINADNVTDERAQQLSFDISQKIEKEMQYPGQIKITVIREMRSVSYAK